MSLHRNVFVFSYCYVQFLTYGYLHFFAVNWTINQVSSVVIVKTNTIFYSVGHCYVRSNGA